MWKRAISSNAGRTAVMASDLPSTMRASQWTTTSGGIEKNLKLNTEAPLPKKAKSLGAGQTLVKVAYTTVNPVDYKLAELLPFVFSKPATPCLDFSGKVAATTLPHVKAGDLVLGKVEPPSSGAAAEYVVVGKDGVAPLPSNVPLDQAACVGVTGLTAYQCIAPFVKAGDKVFINGGSGGTGTFGIQIAKALGLYVTTSCSGPNVELCKSLGADQVIDYRTENVVDTLKRQGTQYDLIVDNVFSGADIYWSTAHYLKPSGRYVTIAGSPSSLVSILKAYIWPSWLGGGKRKFQFLGAKDNPEHFAQVAKWIAEGKVKAFIEQEFELDAVDKAFERLKTGRTRGKLVIKVAAE